MDDLFKILVSDARKTKVMLDIRRLQQHVSADVNVESISFPIHIRPIAACFRRDVILVNEEHYYFLAVHHTGNKARIYLERLKAGDVDKISALTNSLTEILS